MRKNNRFLRAARITRNKVVSKVSADIGYRQLMTLKTTSSFVYLRIGYFEHSSISALGDLSSNRVLSLFSSDQTILSGQFVFDRTARGIRSLNTLQVNRHSTEKVVDRL